MGNGTEKPVEILLAEDNPGDVRLTQEAFKRAKVRTHLNLASDGESALAFLRRKGEYSKAVRPDLIILDLNMPGKDGREVLKEVKKDPALDCIPVIVLTSSAAEDDVVNSYKLHASCYISKPADLNSFNAVVRSIEHFWLTTARLPRGCRDSGGRM
jgi:chemotaxis family two-component system response regulator Rcp1